MIKLITAWRKYKNGKVFFFFKKKKLDKTA